MERKHSDIEQIFEDDGSEEAIVDADDTGMLSEERQIFQTEIAQALSNEADEGSEESAT
ncbi:MAG: hypothetical protein JO322_06395 [Candidatus Eremiobacteraeota bacterium]|nr:hypothetical protein [Candidatus Eremiobacteraeota bacterium]